VKSPAARGSPGPVGKGHESSEHPRALLFPAFLCCKLIPIPRTSSRLSFCLRLWPPFVPPNLPHKPGAEARCLQARERGRRPGLPRLPQPAQGGTQTLPSTMALGRGVRGQPGCCHPLRHPRPSPLGNLRDQARGGGEAGLGGQRGRTGLGGRRLLGAQCCTAPSASTARHGTARHGTAQHGWAALCSPRARQARQLPAKTRRAAIVTMTTNLPACPAREGDDTVPGARRLSATKQLRNKKWGFVEGEIWAKLVVFNCKLQEAEGRVVDATCSDFSKTFDNCSNACCQINSEQLSCQHRHMDKTQAARGTAKSLAVSRELPGLHDPRRLSKPLLQEWVPREGRNAATAAGPPGTGRAAVLPGQERVWRAPGQEPPAPRELRCPKHHAGSSPGARLLGPGLQQSLPTGQGQPNRPTPQPVAA